MSVTLTLRVSSDKRKPGVKASNVKEENILKVIDRLRLVTSDVPGCSDYFDELEKAPDLKTQLEILRKGFPSSNCLENGDKKGHLYWKTLVEILLSLELKSSLRSGIVRILKDDKHGNPVIIQNVIAEGLRNRFDGINGSVASLLEVANILCGCFDNFPLAVKAVRSCHKEAYAFIVTGLKLCHSYGSTNGANVGPELCQCTHVLLRAALHVYGLHQPVDVNELHELARQLLSCDWLPLDTRTNSGLLAVTSGISHWPKMAEEQLISKDDLSSLCLYSGLISCLTVSQLSDCLIQDKTAILFMFDSIMDIHHRNPLHPVMTLGVARTLVSLSRLLLSDNSPLPLLLPRLLVYTWEHLEHVMVSVKHLASTLLQNIVKMHSPAVDVFGAIQKAMADLPVWGRARHMAMSMLIGKLPISDLVNNQGDISRMYQHLSQDVVSSHAINIIQELMKQHYQELEDKQQWRALWVDPLLCHLDSNGCVPLQQVLTTALTVCPDIIRHIISLPKNKVSLGTRLLCLRQARRLGLPTKVTDDTLWRGLATYDTLDSAIHHHQEQIQLSGLALIVEGPKTTEPFTLYELSLIKEHISHNLNMEFPAFRQRNIALLSKFVSRLTNSQAVLERSKSLEDSKDLSYYHEYRQLLVTSCVDNLFPGATYSRRVTALSLLSTLGLSATPSPSTVTALMACLADSYEDIKLIAMNLLTNTNGLLHNIMGPKTVVRCLECSLTHAGGVKPPECLTAAYLLATLVKCPATPATLAAIADTYHCCAPFVNDTHIEYQLVYCCMLIVIDQLTQQLKVAQTSLLKAACSGPLYGLLFSAKLLLSQINLRDCCSQHWQELITRLVDLSFRCSQAVASVVNSDSPEGHLPMDFDFDPTEVCGGGGEDGEEGVTGVTSQMVLLCSWRTVKEVSLLLGYLVESASIALTITDEGLLSSEEVLRIGGHLTTLLAQTKHRGAFEQAYVGFCKLVSRLWRLPKGLLRNLPCKWLEETMDEIYEGAGSLCATRRSAGVPFMIQALICTQLEVEGSAAIEPWVQRLLNMADSPVSPSTTRTHALNILRALFRNTQLGETVTIFVERAFIITITAFSANSWMERNSATLLLSALMTRVFGVPRSKSQDQLSWKNKMTGRIFFQRYPKLFGFFQDELRKASHCLSGNLHPSLYPVLLVIGRLYPSSLEGSDSNIQLAKYIPDVMVCAGSNIYKTRVLAASAMVALMTLPHFDSLIAKVTQPTMPANLRHGLLLQVLYSLKNSESWSDQNLLNATVGSWAKNLKRLFTTKMCFAELEVLFSVFDHLCKKFFQFVPINIWSEVANKAEHILTVSQSSSLNMSCLMRTRVCELLLKLLTLINVESLDQLCLKLLTDDMFDVRHTVLDFISCLHSDINCSQTFCKFFNSVCSIDSRNHCQSHTSGTLDTFVTCVLNMFFPHDGETHPEDKSKLLMTLRNWKDAFVKMLGANERYGELKHLDFIIDLCKDQHEVVAYNSLYCLSEFMCLKVSWEEEEISAICEILVWLCSRDDSGVFDEVVYQLLEKHFAIFQRSTSPVNRLMIYKSYIQLISSREWDSAVDRVCASESDITVMAALLTALTLGQYQMTTQDTVVGRVFDQSGVNETYEELMLSRVCSRRLCFLNCIEDQPLDPAVTHWLATQTGLEARSLVELTTFIHLAKLQILELDSEDLCKFMNQGYQQFRLNCLKLNNFK